MSYIKVYMDLLLIILKITLNILMLNNMYNPKEKVAIIVRSNENRNYQTLKLIIIQYVEYPNFQKIE